MSQKLVIGKYYVIDIFGRGNERIVSGPFNTFDDAEKDRIEYSLADDYVITLCKDEYKDGKKITKIEMVTN